MMHTAVLVDGSSILYRAFFAMPHLTTATGKPTGAILGTTTMLLSIIEELQPEYMGMFFDRKAATYRHELFQDYKANRETMPDELVSQLANLKRLVHALGIPTHERDGLEADDFIGIYSRFAGERGVPCIIYSGDNDLLQLTDSNTSVRITVKGVKQIREYTPTVIAEEFGMTARQLIDVKALMGDSSDNIPGVRGIGEKTALRLIQECGSIDNLLQSGGPERYKELIAENRDLILRNRSLVTITRNSDEPVTLEDLRRSTPNAAEASHMFESLSFVTLAKRASRVLEIPLTVPANVSRDNLFTDETSTTTIAPDNRESTADDRSALAVIPDTREGNLTVAWRTRDGSRISQIDTVFGSTGAILAPDDHRMTYVYDYKSLCRTLVAAELPVPRKARDIMLAQYLLDPDQKAWALDRIGTAWHVSADTSTAAGLADLIYQVSYPLEEAIESAQLTRTLDELEMPFAAVLADMERAGIRTDTNCLRVLGARLGQRIAELEKHVYQLVGSREYSLQSPKQLATLLYDILGLAPTKRTKTGLSTDVESLEAIQNQHPAIPLILEFRQLTKIKGTYADSLVRYVGTDGKIHPTFL